MGESEPAVGDFKDEEDYTSSVKHGDFLVDVVLSRKGVSGLEEWMWTLTSAPLCGCQSCVVVLVSVFISSRR